jgi:hypothetical protein
MTNDDKRALIVSNAPDFVDSDECIYLGRKPPSFGLPLAPEKEIPGSPASDFSRIAFYRFAPRILVRITHLIVVSRNGNTRASLFEPDGRELLPFELEPGQCLTFSLEIPKGATRTVWVRGYDLS